jgi:DMSO/TMAO reductase YedYZ molybdopterin-dependent catalytic subunit
MPPRCVRALASAAIAMVLALAVSVSGVLAHDRGQRSSGALPAGSFAVTGNVQQKLRLSVADLAAMPDQQSVKVTYHAGGGTEDHVFTGPLLLDVLTRALPRFDPAIKNDKLRHYVSVTASDAYQALVAYGELDPSFENKQILLAVTQDGASLADHGPRLVVPGDLAGGRYVTGVVRVKLDKPRRGGDEIDVRR